MDSLSLAAQAYGKKECRFGRNNKSGSFQPLEGNWQHGHATPSWKPAPRCASLRELQHTVRSRCTATRALEVEQGPWTLFLRTFPVPCGQGRPFPWVMLV